MNTQKLYLVTLKGMTSSSTSVANGKSYVVAENPTAAYNAVRADLDKRDIGFSKDRELHSIELIAENYDYTNTGHKLYLP